jgi:hypothetical protein
LDFDTVASDTDSPSAGTMTSMDGCRRTA